MPETPEFVRWALFRGCPLRDYDDAFDPERTERHLRPLRAYSDAVADGRLFEGICLDVVADAHRGESNDAACVKGFRADEILNVFGGKQLVARNCATCPANALAAIQPNALAGCYGWFEIASLGAAFHVAVEQCIAQLHLGSDFQQAFLETVPRWYGLWIESPLGPKRTRLLAELIEYLCEDGTELAASLHDVSLALRTSLDHALPLHIQFVPRGCAEHGRWTILPHCPRCRAIWKGLQRRCSVCGLSGQPRPAKTRCERGSRPYIPLRNFLSQEAANSLISQFTASARP